MKLTTTFIPQIEGPEEPPKLCRDLHYEDSGMAAILNVDLPSSETLAVTLTSWDEETKEHKDLMALLDGRPLRITIEHVEDGE